MFFSYKVFKTLLSLDNFEVKHCHSGFIYLFICFWQIPFIKDCGEDELCICDLVLNVQQKGDDR